MTSSSECDFKSEIISETLPKQAKPAFLVLAPCGKIPFSRIKILASGNRSLSRIEGVKWCHMPVVFIWLYFYVYALRQLCL